MLAGAHSKLLTALFSCAMGLLIGGNSVLCIGSDGHVALEQFRAHCCSGFLGDTGSAMSGSARPDSQLTDCGDCTDTELRTAHPAGQSDPYGSLNPPASLTAAEPWPVRMGVGTVERFPSADPLPRSLTLARSISLLC